MYRVTNALGVKFFSLLLAIAISSVFTLNADELSDAYEKEYTFLKAQKKWIIFKIRKREKSSQKWNSKNRSKS